MFWVSAGCGCFFRPKLLGCGAPTTALTWAFVSSKVVSSGYGLTSANFHHGSRAWSRIFCAEKPCPLRRSRRSGHRYLHIVTVTSGYRGAALRRPADVQPADRVRRRRRRRRRRRGLAAAAAVRPAPRCPRRPGRPAAADGRNGLDPGRRDGRPGHLGPALSAGTAGCSPAWRPAASSDRSSATGSSGGSPRPGASSTGPTPERRRRIRRSMGRSGTRGRGRGRRPDHHAGRRPRAA